MSSAPAKLVIISGRSGSGKSTALHVLEDAGYYCIDNLPAALLPQLVGLTASAKTPELESIAVGIDARNMQADIRRFEEILNEIESIVTAKIIFLDARDEALLARFSETRRRHPLSGPQRSLPEALAKESEILQAIADTAELHVDTSELTLHDLRDLINRTIVTDQNGMALLIESFGYRNGLPHNADMVFDVRCLPNPHWIPSLRAGTGKDIEVRTFLDSQPEVQRMFDDIDAMLSHWLPEFARSNRSYTTVAVGCTGGRHRSVYLCERLFTTYKPQFPNIQLRHRELGDLVLLENDGTS